MLASHSAFRALPPGLAGGIGSASLPVAVDLVPLLDPLIAQLDVQLEVRCPRLDDLRVVAGRIEWWLLQGREIAEFLDVEGLTLVGHAPIQEQLSGIRIGRSLRHTGR